MVEPAKLDSGRVVLTRTDNSLREASQTTAQPTPNPEVKVFSTNPITPSSVIVPKTLTPVQTVTTNKPEFVVDISKYFLTSYPQLEEEHIMLFNQKAIMTLPEFRFILPMNWMLGKPKTEEEYNKLLKLVSFRPEIREGYRYREQNGVVSHANLPKEFVQKLELLAKSHVYLYAAHKDLEDYGMDMDYLTTPTIDHDSEGKEIQILGYGNYSYIRGLAQYDKLLSEYNGVSTVGKLGRVLGISGIQLYGLWKELIKAGLVNTYTYKLTNRYVTDQEYTSNKWLEVASSVNVKELVAKLEVPSGVKTKLESYLLTLQNGKKRDSEFINSYEKLKKEYLSNVLVNNYLSMGGMILGGLIDVDRNIMMDWLNKEYMSKAKELENEYELFAYDIRDSLIGVTKRKDEKHVAGFYKLLISSLEEEKAKFQGRIPLGQEHLFYLLELVDRVKNDKYNNGFYDVKVK